MLVVGLVVGETVLGADGAARRVLIGAGRVRLLGRVRREPHETLLAEGLLKDRLVKAAEGGTEIFKVGEEELLVPLGHVVLGLGRLLQAQRLGHGLRVTAHRCVAVYAAHAVEVDRGQALVREAVVKAAPGTVAALLVRVVQRHLVSHSVDCQRWRGTSRDHTLHPQRVRLQAVRRGGSFSRARPLLGSRGQRVFFWIGVNGPIRTLSRVVFGARHFEKTLVQ